MKENFFYKNTNEYCSISWWMMITCSIIISSILLKICGLITSEYDFYANIVIAIATGYIISFFYYKNITLKSIELKEKFKLKALFTVGYILLNNSNISGDNEIYIKNLTLSLKYNITPYCNALNEHYIPHIYFVNILTQISYIEMMGYTKNNFNLAIQNSLKSYKIAFFSFKDYEDIFKMLSLIQNDHTNYLNLFNYLNSNRP